ncbi:unnamed protein product [Moneuplotes crassus]|uniref:Uncharacterized protein n=1 Tax=Euplotes crassus TaxID=5936 RepID=A0AAD1TYS9_EUPCR|nr:unnamed protein product [Moneuplotes crassus]
MAKVNRNLKKHMEELLRSKNYLGHKKKWNEVYLEISNQSRNEVGGAQDFNSVMVGEEAPKYVPRRILGLPHTKQYATQLSPEISPVRDLKANETKESMTKISTDERSKDWIKADEEVKSSQSNTKGEGDTHHSLDRSKEREEEDNIEDFINKYCKSYPSPFTWKLSKLCESPNAFIDFKKKNMRFVKEYDNIFEMRRMRYGKYQSKSIITELKKKYSKANKRKKDTVPKLSKVIEDYAARFGDGSIGRYRHHDFSKNWNETFKGSSMDYNNHLQRRSTIYAENVVRKIRKASRMNKKTPVPRYLNAQISSKAFSLASSKASTSKAPSKFTKSPQSSTNGTRNRFLAEKVSSAKQNRRSRIPRNKRLILSVDNGKPGQGPGKILVQDTKSSTKKERLKSGNPFQRQKRRKEFRYIFGFYRLIALNQEFLTTLRSIPLYIPKPMLTLTTKIKICCKLIEHLRWKISHMMNS